MRCGAGDQSAGSALLTAAARHRGTGVAMQQGLLGRAGRRLLANAGRSGKAAAGVLGSQRSFASSALAAGSAAAWLARRRTGLLGRASPGRKGVASAAQVSSTKEAPAGEWAFRASVLGCEGALSGHVYLDPSGRLAYLADGVQIVGRGVGHWATNGEIVAVEMDVYQYAAAAAQIPEKPHRFRGVWEVNGSASGPQQGDWFFCPEGNEAPRLVGGLDAAADTMELLPLAMAGSAAAGPAPRVPAVNRDAAMAALDSQCNLRASPEDFVHEERLAPYKVGDINNIYYIPNWIAPEQESEFMAIADGDMSSWEDMRTRSSQEWGAGDRCVCGRGLTRQPLPPSQQKVADALHQLGVFDRALFPMNSVRINGYRPGQGIHPHCDGPVYYPKVAILSLGSPCLFSFYPRSGTEDCMKWDSANDVPGGFPQGLPPQNTVFLEPRSLLVFNQDAFWHNRHGIDAVASDKITEDLVNLDQAVACGYKPGDTLQRARRVSLTMRHLLPRCACQG